MHIATSATAFDGHLRFAKGIVACWIERPLNVAVQCAQGVSALGSSRDIFASRAFFFLFDLYK